MTLLDALIERIDGSIRDRVDVVSICEPIVIVVVTSARNQQRDHVQMVKFPDLYQISFSHDHEQLLHHISAMEVVMVLNFAQVSRLNRVEER